ncbi:MAG: CBS domain-containing protein [Solirubrobacteraceae bacterium]|nr:MAG: CBS domain-containing protein [Solirubrobacterales bacterium]
MRVHEVMTASVVTAGLSCTVREAAELMREHNVGSIVLTDEDRHPISLVTDRDLTVSVLAAGEAAAGPARDHGSSPVVCGEPGMDVADAAALMAEHGVRRLPVLEDERLAGIVTLDDIAVRTGDLALGQRLATRITAAALPDFYFHERGD